jgi:hypothetical protein
LLFERKGGVNFYPILEMWEERDLEGTYIGSENSGTRRREYMVLRTRTLEVSVVQLPVIDTSISQDEVTSAEGNVGSRLLQLTI